jgi:hypothetical protein
MWASITWSSEGFFNVQIIRNYSLYFIPYQLIKQNFEIIIASTIGSLLDLDHFIAAKSFYFYGATHLTTRPFGHNVFFCLIIVLITKCFTNNKRYTALAFSSLISHLLRDSVRRGLLLWPFGSTASIPIYYVIIIYVIIAIVLLNILSKEFFLSILRYNNEYENISIV